MPGLTTEAPDGGIAALTRGDFQRIADLVRESDATVFLEHAAHVRLRAGPVKGSDRRSPGSRLTVDVRAGAALTRRESSGTVTELSMPIDDVAARSGPMMDAATPRHHLGRTAKPCDLEVAFVTEAACRRVAVSGRKETGQKETGQKDPIAKHDCWARLSCMVTSATGTQLGKSTSIVRRPSHVPGDASASLQWVLDTWIHNEDFDRLTEEALEQARRLNAAEPTPTGRMPVILAPRAAGTLVHELLGHYLERDNVAAGGAVPAIGARIAPETVSFAHDATPRFPWGGAPFDDDGTTTARHALVDGGLVIDHITTNARRAGYHLPAVPRMSTVEMAPGSDTDLLSGPDALLIKEFNDAAMHPRTGRCVARIREAQVITKGTPRGIRYGGALSLRIADALTEIERVGADAIYTPSLCTKAQQKLPVGVVAPSLRFRELAIR